ncbi:MAG: hypothetical protein A2666_04960 [Parcubacteria group bacterium RIFCSPHIGHO2_01_FULL_47_10b]|nr:MAG: hypothetical protein A2666_04960 [Parcubacteria group bacterium RIFCSPHIGHO2_01_FULL_47_10b]
MNLRSNLFLFTGGLLAFAVSAQASVVINEIAWMGTAASSNDEWIELYNTDTVPVELDGWLLMATDALPTIPLAGIIGPQSFFLLERTDDTTVNDTPADLIYSGSLSNETESLALIDTTGAIVDLVPRWYAGDSTTHASMERADPEQAGDDAMNWHTHTGSPTAGRDANNAPLHATARAANSIALATATSTIPSTDSDETDSNENPDNADNQAPDEPTDTTHATTTRATIAVVINGVDREADELAIGQNKGITLKAKGDPATHYAWNWGNGVTSEGNLITVSYQFPGTYLLTMHATFSDSVSSDQLKIQVYPSSVTISEFLPDPPKNESEDEWIELYNSSDVVVDLYGFQLDDADGGSRPFVIPQYTFLLPSNYLVFPRSLTKLALNNDNDSVRLLTPSGTVIMDINYTGSKKGYVGVLTDTEGFVWSSKPTPGFANIVNPNNAVVTTIVEPSQAATSIKTQNELAAPAITNASNTISVSPGHQLSSLMMAAQGVLDVTGQPRNQLAIVEESQKIGHTVSGSNIIDIVGTAQAAAPYAVITDDSTATNDDPDQIQTPEKQQQAAAIRKTTGISFMVIGSIMLLLITIGFVRTRFTQNHTPQKI